MSLRSPLISIAAHRTAMEARSGQIPLVHAEHAHLARAYSVTYNFETLAGPNRRLRNARVLFELVAGGNYPFTPPATTVISRPIPWTPHFEPQNGLVCLGNGWSESRGKMLFAQLVIHVARLLNFDEPPRPGYTGLQSDAARHWERVMRYRPMNPGLKYPALSTALTHGVGAVSGKPLFRIRSHDAGIATKPLLRVRRVY